MGDPTVEEAEIVDELLSAIADIDDLERRWLALTEAQRQSIRFRNPGLARWFGIVKQ